MLYSDKRKTYYKYLIYLFPALYLILGFYFRQVFGDLSLRSNDPEYIHFISGLCVSTGKFAQANIDQPASPLHLLLAIVFRIVYFFREHNLPYFEDVIRNSDLYLSVANLVITAIIAGVMLWVGKAVEKITKNILYAVVIQTSPLIINVWYEIIGRIYVELLFVLPIFILQALLFREIYKQQEINNSKTFYYGFAVALGMSLKMTFFPFLVLPLFLIKDFRNKLKYLLYTAISFCFLALPVVFQFNKFIHWMMDLFLHNGIYLAGPKTVINPSLFLKNVSILISSQGGFFYVVLALFILLLVLVLTKSKKSVLKNLNLGLTVVIIGFIFIVGKHYVLRYFLPALLFFPFLLILVKENIASISSNKIVSMLLSIILVIIIGYKLERQVPYIRIVSESIGSQMAARIETRDVAQTLKKDSYKIIVSQDYGCPFQGYAIMYSFCMGGKNWPGYEEKLNKLYPDTYQYFTWDNTIKYWGQSFDPNVISASGKPVYLYLEKNTDALYKKTINKLFENFKGYTIKKKLIFDNPHNGEAILQLYFSKTKQQDTISGF